MPLATHESGPERFKPFAYLTAPNAALYRQVMLAFVAAKRRFVVHLRSADVVQALAVDGPTDEKAIADALAKLEEWGNLRADPDTSRVTGVEDFYRARFLYQLTNAGEAAERSLAVFDEQLGRRGALQAVALEDIAIGLGAIRELAQDPEPDVGRTGLLLRDIVRRCADLAENAQAFMGSLQRTIDLYELDAEAFRAYKDRLIEYLERFIKDLTGRGGEIAELIEGLDPSGIDRLLELVARRDAEDAAPGRVRRRPTTSSARRRSPPSWPRGRNGGSGCGSGSSPRLITRARRSCCAFAHVRRFRTCSPLSRSSTSAAPAARIAPPISVSWRCGSRRRRTRPPCTSSGRRRLACTARVISRSTPTANKRA